MLALITYIFFLHFCTLNVWYYEIHEQARQKHIKGHGAQPPFEFHLGFFLEMIEVKYLLQYDKYPNYPKFTRGQLHSEIGIRRYVPVTWRA